MEAQCRAISCSHGGPVQGPSLFTWRPSAGSISSSHESPVQGPSPQSGARHAAQLGGCQPGLHPQGIRSEGPGQHTHHLHPGWTDYYVCGTNANSKGPKRSPCCTPDSELIWPSECHNRGYQGTHGGTQQKRWHTHKELLA